MAHSDTYEHRPYMTRKNLGDDVYIEIMDIRVKNGRVECLSRFNRIKGDGPFIGTFGYRWRKICGKGVFVPSLDRTAKDEHCLSLSVHNPVNGKTNRIYIRDFDMEWFKCITLILAL